MIKSRSDFIYEWIRSSKKCKNEFPEKICIIMPHHYQNEKVAKDLGADAFLAKPFYIDELFELVQR